MRLTAMPLPFQSLHEEMDRMLKGAMPARTRAQALDFELNESETGYELIADLPGCRHEDIEISIEGPVLHLRARRKPGPDESADRKILRRRPEFEIEESLRFPVELDGDAVQATLHCGELHLVLPKQKSKLPRRIEIRRS